MIFSDKELERIILSILILSFAFMFSFFHKAGVIIFLISFIITTISYIIREYAHYSSAKKFGFKSEYKLWAPGAVIAAISSLFPFTFAVLGYVKLESKYHDHVDVNLNDIGPFKWEIPLGIRKALISYMGILSNLGIGMFFLAFPLFDILTLPFNFFKFGAFINLSLALFNLLPVPDLDGIRVMVWRASVWVSTTLITAILLILVYLL